MSQPDLLQLERDLIARNNAIDARTAEVLQMVGVQSLPSNVPSHDTPSPKAVPEKALVRQRDQGSASEAMLISKVAALEEELRAALQQNQSLQAEKAKANEEVSKQMRLVTQAATKAEKDRASKEDAVQKLKLAETQLANFKKEAISLNKCVKLAETNSATKDARLQKATEELERWKAQMQATKKEVDSCSKESMARLQAENKRLLAQKQELLVGFKKQVKLIDILKRQKMHIEAAKLLSFTEQEYSRVLEMGSTMGA